MGKMNRFKYHMTCINLHNLSLFLGLSFLVSESILWFNESIHSVVFVRKWFLVTPHYINPSPHNSKIIESFATILRMLVEIVSWFSQED